MDSNRSLQEEYHTLDLFILVFEAGAPLFRNVVKYFTDRIELDLTNNDRLSYNLDSSDPVTRHLNFDRFINHTETQKLIKKKKKYFSDDQINQLKCGINGLDITLAASVLINLIFKIDSSKELKDFYKKIKDSINRQTAVSKAEEIFFLSYRIKDLRNKISHITEFVSEINSIERDLLKCAELVDCQKLIEGLIQQSKDNLRYKPELFLENTKECLVNCIQDAEWFHKLDDGPKKEVKTKIASFQNSKFHNSNQFIIGIKELFGHINPFTGIQKADIDELKDSK